MILRQSYAAARVVGFVLLLGLLVGWFGLGPLAPSPAQAQQQSGIFRNVTVGQLAGVRLDAANPPQGVPGSGLVLGPGADLLALGGDVTIRQLAGDLAQGATIERQSGGGLTSGTYCYLLTAFVDDKESLQGAGPSQISVEQGQQVILSWQVAEQLRQLVQFGAKVGYRIYRGGPLPANTPCTAVQLAQYARLGELTLTSPVPPSLSFVDNGRQGPVGGGPQLKAGGNLTVDGNATVNNATVNRNLTVGQLAQVTSLQVGATPIPGANNAWIAGSLFLGPKGWEWRPAPATPVPVMRRPTGAAAPGKLMLMERFPGADIGRLEITGPGGLFTLNLGDPSTPAAGSFTIADLAVGLGLFCGGANPRLNINAAGAVGLGVAPAAGSPAGALEIAHSLGVGAAAPAPCGDAIINNNLAVNNNLTVSQQALLGALIVQQNAQINQNLNIGLNAQIGQDLDVGRNAHILGRVGIGTNQPEHTLHVLGDRIRLENLDDPNKILDLRVDGQQVDIESRGAPLILNFGQSDRQNTLMNVLAGNVGIGLDEPEAKLHILAKPDDPVGLRLSSQGPGRDAIFETTTDNDLDLMLEAAGKSRFDLVTFKNGGLGIVDCGSLPSIACLAFAAIPANASLLVQGGQIKLFNFDGSRGQPQAIGTGAIYFDTAANPVTGDPANTPYFWDGTQWVPLRGLKCWDLNGNGRPDRPAEDTNGDGAVNVLDCKGPKGDKGDPGPRGEVDFSKADQRYVLKPRDETDLTIGSLFSLGQLAGDWLAVGEPRDNTNFWALINPDNGPDLALGTAEPPDLSELKLTVLEFERASGLVRVSHDLTVEGALTVKGSLTLEDLEVNGNLRVSGATELEDLTGRDAEFDNVTVNRDLKVKGVKFFVQQHPTDPTREISYAALEGPEAGTYIRGAAELVNGAAVIELPEHFALVTSQEGLTVQLTPMGEWLQLYVVELSPQRLVVREAQGKEGRFFYRVEGVRKGYEGFEPIRVKEVK